MGFPPPPPSNPTPVQPQIPNRLPSNYQDPPEGVGTILQDQLGQIQDIGLVTANFNGEQIRGILYGLPVAEQNQEYFAVVKEAGDTSPEIIDQTQFKVTYLCDSQLNVSKPATDTVALSNITQNFESQRRAIVRVDEGTVLNPQLAGTHKITAVGSVEPIIGTQIGKGPLSYVTTMSFVQSDQLGRAPGINVASYYSWFDKSANSTGGYQDRYWAYKVTGTRPNGNSWTLPAYVTSSFCGFDDPGNEGRGIRLHQDTQQLIGTGSALGDPGFEQALPSGPDGTFDSTNYFNTYFIETGSIAGGSRIRVSCGAAFQIVSSSIRDLFASARAMDLGGTTYDGFGNVTSMGDFESGFYNFWDISRYASVKLQVYSQDPGEDPVLRGENSALLDIFNPAYGTLPYAFQDLFESGSDDFSSVVPGVDFNDYAGGWRPLYGNGTTQVVTDYFDVVSGSKVFALIKNQEAGGGEDSSSLSLTQTFDSGTLFNGSDLSQADGVFGLSFTTNGEFTQSLNNWPEHNMRYYKYWAGHFIINQETPAGSTDFVQGITGVTASYFNGETMDLPQPSASVYTHNTSSFWVGKNDFSSSVDGVGSYITASTALTYFYGEEFTNVAAGTEHYNLNNAEFSPSSSLFQFGPNAEEDLSTSKKRTAQSFGFNPIRLPFLLQIGDFIRFEYSKSKTFQITGIQIIGNTLKLRLDGQVPDSTILDNFVIYRIIPNGQYIILDVKKNNDAAIDQPFTGIITGKYPSTGLTGKIDKLLFELKQAGIIEV